MQTNSLSAKKAYLLISSIVLSFFLCFVSCSDDNVKDTEKDGVVFNASTFKSEKGYKIAEINEDGEITITADRDSILKAFEAVSDSSYVYNAVEVVPQDINGDSSEIEYLLTATSYGNGNYTAKTAVSLNLESQSFYLSNILAESVRITCTSECQFGCTPTRLRNPAGQIELTCIKCFDGKKCTKSVSM